MKNACLLALCLGFAACESSPPPRPLPTVTARPTGPATAFADVELFGENPLGAFQRTGNPPLPIGTYPVNTPVQVLAKSGAFYQVSMPDGRVGWMAARGITGVYTDVPDWSGGTAAPVAPPTVAPPANGLPPSNPPDTIDLDRIP